MRPCIVGIGGAGGNILRQFLQCRDAELAGFSFGEHLTFGEVKGLWLESAAHDVQDQRFYGKLTSGLYPGYVICHDSINADSPTRKYVMDVYGFDLKIQGYDRRAEYLKGIFEVFDADPELQRIAVDEFSGEGNPLAGFIWKSGIRPYTTISEYNQHCEARPPDADNLLGMLRFPNSSKEKNGKDNSAKGCDSILFIASLGGGTGTGFINPIASYVRSEELGFPIFALGVLTEKGTDSRGAPEGQRDLGAVIAMNDLLTLGAGKGIDGLIMIDNQVLLQKYKGNFPAMDREICSALRPLLDPRDYPGSEQQKDMLAMRRVIWKADRTNGNHENGKTILLPPLLVPCYHFRNGSKGSIDSLVKEALSANGRLFPCDPTRADRAYVFTRGFFKKEDIKAAVAGALQMDSKEAEEKVHVYRKIGNGSQDILIVLRNPYGGTSRGQAGDDLKQRIYDVVSNAIGYLDENPTNIMGSMGYSELTKDRLFEYFYGSRGLREELVRCQERLMKGERPAFVRSIEIFDEVSGGQAGKGGEIGRMEQSEMEKLIELELERLLHSEKFRKKIREMMA
ncbi:MAG: hypothetical protein HPY61_03695 [Methanotrichaceae archaeon]|nr:hypothetical protein [Methanotrichaceae archaeon]